MALGARWSRGVSSGGKSATSRHECYARTGIRTRTPLRARDFKSLASTRFAIPALSDKGEQNRQGNARSPFSFLLPSLSRAGNGTRTRDPNLGKVVLYQLSYSRAPRNI